MTKIRVQKVQRTIRIEEDCGYTYKIHRAKIDYKWYEIIEAQTDGSLSMLEGNFTFDEQDEIYNQLHKMI